MANQVHEVIVYRSPAEKAMWDLTSNGEFFPVICALVVFVISFIIIHKINEKVFGSIRIPAWATYSGLFIAGCFAVLTGWKMWL